VHRTRFVFSDSLQAGGYLHACEGEGEIVGYGAVGHGAANMAEILRGSVRTGSSRASCAWPTESPNCMALLLINTGHVASVVQNRLATNLLIDRPPNRNPRAHI
jgi:hypothetical protein